MCSTTKLVLLDCLLFVASMANHDSISLAVQLQPVKTVLRPTPRNAKKDSLNNNKDESPPYDALHTPLQKVLHNQVMVLAAALKKHNFIFWLSSGTAIGAVRDGAIIPYDEDADISVFIKDWDTEAGDKEYDRLLALGNELSDYTIVSTPPHEMHWESFYRYPENEMQKKFYAFSGPKGYDTGARCCLLIHREGANGTIESLYPFDASVNSSDIVKFSLEKDWVFPLATATLGGHQLPVMANASAEFQLWSYTDLRPDRCYDESLNRWRSFWFYETRCAKYCKCPGFLGQVPAHTMNTMGYAVVVFCSLLFWIGVLFGVCLAFRARSPANKRMV